MWKKKTALLLILLLVFVSGCGGKEEEKDAAPSPTPEHMEAPVIQGDGDLAETAKAVMSVYADELSIVSSRSFDNLTYAIPVSAINQFIQDATASGEAPSDGYYRFSWTQGGDYTYETTVDDAPELESVTPDPHDETPMELQLNGDYAVSGGGLFERVRSYEIAETVTRGRMEISDTLNGEMTGHEYFSFSVRDGDLYFVDATLNITIDMSGKEIQDGFLTAVGVLRADSLEILECLYTDPEQFPDPAKMNWAQFIAEAKPLTRLSAQGENVTFSP
ncbi:MAG: hypothetical protein IK099_15620 [Clostridia bacterium]|nr:hypothetical protein [Clostridia bacterium]